MFTKPLQNEKDKLHCLMYIFHAEHRLHCRIGECIIVYKIYECLVG